MSWSFPIGRLFGSQLRVHATFFLLLAFIGASTWSESGPEAALWTVVFVLLLFACVVAHEFGHALMARRFGIRTPDITLLPIGGLARLERMPEKPGQEILVALAGPAVNVVIWLILTLVLSAPTETEQLTGTAISPSTLPAQLATLNLVLAIFNLIPAFPMDGGRVLRAVLTLFTDRVRATRIAAGAGQMVAFLMAATGFMSGNLMLVLIAGFIFFAASGESADVAMRDVARKLMARDAMITEYEVLRPDDLISLAATTLIRTTQHEFPVLDMQGHLAGFLTREALFHAMAEGASDTRVGNVMQSVPSATLTDGLEMILERLGTGPAVAVLDREGYLLGYITRENVGELMVIANARR
ncbi:Putative zinc metalloprotease Rip3 [Aliiroseovarius pelagivivens]|uniref:Zinc metalloprotease n=1 Tax=Aliiroseovarius pelagivivens TaxID=1639690 RepID=A0A2R8AK05_9RHOB|nr:site-2 protease family protein [Aliiroseovarius pelagivivens]SPF76360.1 Putative zinc metalloprotease Rip3 [Aliiroseovarius pelagivivens]